MTTNAPRNLKALAILLIAASLAPAPAHAALERVGPNDPKNFLPVWYQDTTGLTMEFCTPRTQAELDGGYCLLLPVDVPTGLAPEVFPGNFSGEHFYWASDVVGDWTYTPPPGAPLPAFTTGRVVFVQAIEAAFLGDIGPGLGGVFGRVRIRVLDLPLTGNYKFYTPWGIKIIPGVAGGRIFDTEDIGINCAAFQYDCALQTSIGPFLLPSNTPGGAELPPVEGPTPGTFFLSDPARVGPVTGSPMPTNYTFADGSQVNPNVFAIEAPDGVLIFQSHDFSTVGRVYTQVIPSRLAVDRTSYARDAGAIAVDVYATGEPTLRPRLPAQPTAPVVQPDLVFFPEPCGGEVSQLGDLLPPYTAPAGQTAQPMSRSGNLYWGQTGLGNLTDLCVSDTNARNALGQVVPSYVPAPLADQVFVTEALYDPSNGGSLSVLAASSDQLNPPPLALGAFGDLAGSVAFVDGLAYVAPLAAPPTKVRVLSAEKGTAELLVVVGSRVASGVTLTADMPSPQTPGIAVVFTAQGEGATHYEYRFLMDSGGGFQVVRDWSPTPTWIMNGATPEGHYLVKVEVWSGLTPSGPDAESTVIPFDRRPAPATGVVVASDRGNPALRTPGGTPTTFSATGTGAAGGFDYRYSISAAGGPFQTVQDYGNGATWVMPASTPSGAYLVKVSVRTSALVDQDAEGSLAVALVLPSPATGGQLVASAPSPSAPGSSVVFTATGSGSLFGGAPSPQEAYDFRFWLDSGSGWTIAQDFGNGPNYTLAAPAAGSYRIAIHVRTTSGVGADFYGPAQVHEVRNVPSPATGLSIATSRAAPSPTGAAVVFSATGSGSTQGGLQSPPSVYAYQFWLNSGAGWQLVQDYGVGSAFALASPASGTYQVLVNAKTSSAALSEVTAMTVHEVLDPATPATGVLVEASASSPSVPGATVNFVATGLGSTRLGVSLAQSGYDFRFFLDAGAGWVMVQDYGHGPIYSLATPPTGTYKVAVHVRTSAQVPADFFGPPVQHVVGVLVTAATGVTLTASPSSPSIAGDSVTFTGTGLGATIGGVPAPPEAYDFRFFLNDGSGWVMVQDYGGGGAYTLVAPAAGSYLIAVHVRTTGTVAADHYGPGTPHVVE